MKTKIFLYLFVFALVSLIFQYMNYKSYSEAKENEVAVLKAEINDLEVENAMNLKAAKEGEDRGFTLKTNTKAREYFEDMQIDVDSIADEIEAKIIAKNHSEEDNSLVPYAGITGTMKINRIEILNHRWVLAEFTDGTYWGEAIIAYFLDEDNNLEFDTIDGFLYSE